MKKVIATVFENDFWFRLTYLVFAMLAFNGLTARTTGLSIAAYAVVLFGACVLLYRVVHFKRYITARGVWLLILFVVSYCVSSLLTREYGILENVQALAWIVLQLLVLYVYDSSRPMEKDRRDVRIVCWVFVVYNFIMAVAALVMFATDYKTFFARQGVYVNIGLWWEGRLWGLYSEVNDGAVLSFLSLIMAIGLWKGARKALRPFLAVHIALQLSYVALTDSRTALVVAAMTAALVVFLVYIRIGKPVNKAVWRYILAVVLAIIVGAGAVGAIKGVQSVGNQIKIMQNEVEEQEAEAENMSAEAEQTSARSASTKETKSDSQKQSNSTSSTKTSEKVVGRTDDELTGDISNRRFSLWKSGFELWRTSPIFGISFRNYVAYAEDNLPDTYIVNTGIASQENYECFHNVFVDVLVSQGLVGLVLFLGFIVSVLVLFFRHYFKARDNDYWYYTFLGACVFSLAISAMFMSNILYVNSPETVLFWMLLSYLIHAITCGAAQEIPQPALEER